jgi:hypothetical protein
MEHKKAGDLIHDHHDLPLRSWLVKKKWLLAKTLWLS